ncbi:PIN domain-containing protein [Paenimyroides baculatum]|uniref:DUF4935 domain-containing protein n=1 Tax=Paenimyroides baculatum TaxID=2608000 RepID=A0A5M6CRR9_9FLAO|nr:PIN domain-containing protein [Paenimyroides baculatum]KAA5537887.1 hypothetical protein F0460_04280 [Paenimyroides baculatum]
MKEKVIFDTNTLRNTEINFFLGNRKELERFAQDADIVVPHVVIEEIKRQKRAVLKGKKDSFIGNPFHNLLGINEAYTKAFDIDNYIENLQLDETIEFDIIDLKSNDVLPIMKELALLKKAPFENADNTDKGFKDALIYFSVLEYLQEVENKYVFVCAKDNLLKEAFKNEPNVIVVKDYEEFKKQSVTQFIGDYFIEKVNAELDITITATDIKNYWNNISDNKVVLVETNGEQFVIESDSGEIINHCNVAEYQPNIERLISSPNFAKTHDYIADLSPYITYFSENEILNLLEKALENEQVKWILGDSDVKEFFGQLFEAKKEQIQDTEIVTYYNNFLNETITWQ